MCVIYFKDVTLGTYYELQNTCTCRKWRWSGGAMVLGKLPVPGRPTNLDYSRTRAFCACSRCGWGLFGHFFSHLSFLFLSPSLRETARYRLKYCLKGLLSPKQPTNQPVESGSILGLSNGFGLYTFGSGAGTGCGTATGAGSEAGIFCPLGGRPGNR